jgi:hypothetical protein
MKDPLKMAPGEEEWEVTRNVVLRSNRAKRKPGMTLWYLYKAENGAIFAMYTESNLDWCRLCRDYWLKAMDLDKRKQELAALNEDGDFSEDERDND